MKAVLLRAGLVFPLLMFSVLCFGDSVADEAARTFMVRGMAAIEMARSDEDFANAAEEFKKAAEIAPDMAAAWFNLGAIQSKLGQFRAAIDSYNHYLVLAPQADDARKIKDEVIKLGYRLEQTEKFDSLSGKWVSADGMLVAIHADSGKLMIQPLLAIEFPGSADTWMYDKYIPGSTYNSRIVIMSLAAKGSQLTGSYEIEGNAGASGSYDGWCALPAEQNAVEGTLEKGRILLKMRKNKYKVVMNQNDGLFSNPKIRCDGVTLAGTMTRELVLMGPLETGGIGFGASETKSGTISIYTSDRDTPAAGLQTGDEIISIDGTDVAPLKTFEKKMKLCGKPGSSVQLVVKRSTGKAGFFSKPKETLLNISVLRVPVKWYTDSW